MQPKAEAATLAGTLGIASYVTSMVGKQAPPGTERARRTEFAREAAASGAATGPPTGGDGPVSSAQASSGSVAGPPTGGGGSGSKGAPSPRRAPLPDQQAAAEVQPKRWPGMGRSRSPMTKRLQKKVTSVVLKAASECVPPAKGPPTTPLVSPRGTADD